MFINIHMCSMNEEGKVHNSNNCMKTDHLHTLLYRVKLWKYSDLNVVYMHESCQRSRGHSCVTSVRIGFLGKHTCNYHWYLTYC